jgi:hypothetical protein
MCGGNEVMRQTEVTTLLKLQETMTVPVILTNCETWTLKKSDRAMLDKMEIWALKKLIGLPKTTPTPAVLFTTGTLMTSLRVDQRQLIYLRRLLCRNDDNWAKQTFFQLEKMKTGWASHMKQLLEEYELNASWEDIGKKKEKQWKNEVTNAINKKQKERLLDSCFSKKGEKSKTKNLISILQDESYIVNPQEHILTRPKIIAKALIMGRFRMLNCAKNFKNLYKDVNCKKCKVMDDESHRINDCELWKDFNHCNNTEKIDFQLIENSDPETLSKIANIILDIWNLKNGKNEMNIAA